MVDIAADLIKKRLYEQLRDDLSSTWLDDEIRAAIIEAVSDYLSDFDNCDFCNCSSQIEDDARQIIFDWACDDAPEESA